MYFLEINITVMCQTNPKKMKELFTNPLRANKLKNMRTPHKLNVPEKTGSHG